MLQSRSAAREHQLEADISALRKGLATESAKIESLRSQIAAAKHAHKSAQVSRLQTELGVAKKNLAKDQTELNIDKTSLAKTLTPTSTQAPVRLSATSRSSVTSSKKGLGYNTASYTNAFGNSLAWAYNWASDPAANTGTLASTVEYVPMLWGSDTSGWAQAAKKAIASGSTHLLGYAPFPSVPHSRLPDAHYTSCVRMNEPDFVHQSNLTTKQAAAEWKTQMKKFYGKVPLVSPAITNGGAPSGVTWLASFLKDCKGCHVEAIAAHWYDRVSD